MTDQPNAAPTVGDDEAARILGIDSHQLDAMVEEGLLDPVTAPEGRTFNTSQVQALRAQGG